MKVFLSILLFGISLSIYGQSIRGKSRYKTIKTILIDINNDGKMDTVILYSSLPGKSSFNRITVSLSGFKKQTFHAKDSWTTVDKWFLDSNKNAVNTKLLFFKKTNKHAVILLFGILDGAGYRGEFSILNIENNVIKMVFDHTDTGGNYDVEDPITLTDLEHDDRLCFIYKGIGELAGFSNN